MNREVLKEQIKRHEGEVLKIYKDSLGYLTFGVGHLVKEGDPEHGQPEGTPVSQERVDEVYDIDFDKHIAEAIHVFGTEEGYEILDCIGNWDGDPGSGWDVAGVENATKNHTLVRKISVLSGNYGNWSLSAGTNEANSDDNS